MNDQFNKIAIIGLGLIGSSIIHALNIKFEKKFNIFVYDINPNYRKIVEKIRKIDEKLLKWSNKRPPFISGIKNDFF